MEPVPNNVITNLESKKRVTKAGIEYWMARELQEILGYDTWRRFEDVIKRAIAACDSSKIDPANQFVGTGNMVEIGSGAQREVENYFLTRYACYLIAMNGDPNKSEIGFAQTYFAIQTRRQELRDQIGGPQDRLQLRERIIRNNKELGKAASRAGVTQYPFFQDAGIRELYGGLGVREIKELKGIPDKEDLLDCAGTDELTFNDFRIVLTRQRLDKDGVKGQKPAEETHRSVSRTVRTAIREAGGTAPEKLKAEPSIRKEIAKARRKRLAAAKSQIPNKT